MVLIETMGQKTKSETPRPRSQKFENPRPKKSQENEISRLIENAFEIARLEQNLSRLWIFRAPFATPNGRNTNKFSHVFVGVTV